ncbi:MAG: hypothetical protein A3K19_22095 [Lentisphaerae bacterium RIFOXYB12_FULL_65_16]|nr:MAG: hypothetical protein A3K18_21475 [Lentisphaerae bacterium RIFOXYA12_64_32]OGV93553.1 MAG: hypothetical protein A3K19_22095 [Lentisphaerae bacterium RIFOXYB12_FULL_65_16]
MGVIFGGHDHIIELNHLYRLNLETCDTGAIYTGGRDAVTPWGCMVRYNYIHEVIGFGREHGTWGSPTFSWGIYLDDLASGATVFGNIVVGCLRGGVHIHSGRHNRIANNILVDGTLQQIEFNGWTDAHPYWAGQVDARQKNWEERQALPEWQHLEFGFTTPTADQPEGIAGMRDLYIRIDCRDNSGTVWIDDLSLREAETVDEWTAWQEMGLDRNSVVADPRFVDAAKNDYRLKPESPALKLGFEPIPVDRIGCYADPRRATWPLVTER